MDTGIEVLKEVLLGRKIPFCFSADFTHISQFPLHHLDFDVVSRRDKVQLKLICKSQLIN